MRTLLPERPFPRWAPFLSLTICCLTVVCAASRPRAQPAANQGDRSASDERPNIVLLIGDDMGYTDIGPYGATDIRTPHLDRLAAQGVRFTDAYSTAPVCTPSRIALLTGRYQQRAGFEGNVRSDAPQIGLATSETTLPRILKDGGYATALFGKWHLGYLPRFMPNAHGFDQFFGFLDWSIDYHSHRTPAGVPGLYENTTPTEQEGYSTNLFTDRAVSFIERHAEGPFFVTVSYNAGLPPFQPPDPPTSEPTVETWMEGTREDYVGVVEAMDAGIGRILDALDHHELTRDTLVIYLHDHGGEELARNAPLAYGFGTLFEGGIRVPCLIRWPARLPAGETSSQMMSTMDLTASILAAAGTPASPERPLDGRNILPILVGETPEMDRALYWRFGSQRAVRRGPWKYVANGDRELLFNLDDDLGERRDLSAGRPGLVSELRDLWQRWEEEVLSG